MKETKSSILKTDLNFSSERLEVISMELPKKLEEIISFDSLGEDKQNIFEIIEGIRKRFIQYSNDIDSPFKIAVVGSQGTGKSTVVNLLLGEALMPSSTMENESAVIRLAYSDDNASVNQALFELNDGSTESRPIDEANLLIDKATRKSQDESFVKSIKYVTFYKKNDRLKEIELINTPGMNVLTEDFYPKVQHLFAEADIIMWVNSSEQILDQFNSWLIHKIHADNNKIVGIITFPDRLYRQDNISGVTDVVSQFMTKLENKRLVRVDGNLGLFILNGKFAQIAFSHKQNLKFINDFKDLEGEEEKLRMIYNFLHHGFAYSDDENNIEILKKYNLYGIEDLGFSKLNDEFELESFFQYCLNLGIFEYSEDSKSALYTEKGRELLGEVSQYNSFGRFSEDYLIPLSKESKFKSVLGRLIRTLSEVENKDNSISRLIQIKKILELEKEKLGSEEKERLSEFEKIIITLKSEYSQWHNREIGSKTDKFSDDLVEFFIKGIDKEINGYDFFKEILGSLTPNSMKNNSETSISKKISEIIEKAIETELPKSIEKLVEEANIQIEYILIDMEKDFLSNKNVKANKPDANYQTISPNINTGKILKDIRELLKPVLKKLLQDLLKKIAEKDLRRGANNFIKKNITKPIVKLIRKLIQTEAKKIVAKKVAESGAKTGMGPVGWALLAIDVLKIGYDIHKMYKEMKASLKETLKNEESFRNIFEEEANRVSSMIIDEVVKELNHDFMKEKKDETYIIDGIVACDNVLTELTDLQNKYSG